MKFLATDLAGALLVEPESLRDERGSFARIWCETELSEHGLDARIAQMSISTNPRRATLRGLHYQRAPHGETKLVRCSRGVIFDVAVDLRPESPTFCHWIAYELSARNGLLLYLPPGLAHGFLTLVDDVEVVYQMSVPYHRESAAGVRWDDPSFAIQWPEPPDVISRRDRTFPDFVR